MTTSTLSDWSAHSVRDAVIGDLDRDAVALARKRLAAALSSRFPSIDIAKLDDWGFLERAGMAQKGGVSRAALLLLGKPESAFHLSPNMAEITWSLEGDQRDYEHFSPPFLLSVPRVIERIRNLTIRFPMPGVLINHETPMYDSHVLAEAIHNCIAHQDYSSGARIVVRERPDRLIFLNAGSFFDGTPDACALGSHAPRHYRNPHLVQMMADLGMIKKTGCGLREIFRRQCGRFMPLPDYDLDEANAVTMTVHGRVMDLAYTQLLMQKTGLPVEQVLALDRIQKRLPVSDEAIRKLRKDGLIEGGKPHIRVSSTVAAATEN